MIAILDYATGNLQSVRNALSRLGAEYVVTYEPAIIAKCSHVLMPGVGEASSAMQRLRERGLDQVVPSLTMPVLGICIGMQLMCRSSQEGDAQCLGIFSTDVLRLSGEGMKIPHVGWDNVKHSPNPLFAGIDQDAYFYYVHSYAARMCPDTIATTCYGSEFSAALARDNFYGTQFHPEKSGDVGERLLQNFLNL